MLQSLRLGVSLTTSSRFGVALVLQLQVWCDFGPILPDLVSLILYRKCQVVWSDVGGQNRPPRIQAG